MRNISKDILKKNLKISFKLALLYAVVQFVIDETSGSGQALLNSSATIYGAIIFGLIIFLITIFKER